MLIEVCQSYSGGKEGEMTAQRPTKLRQELYGKIAAPNEFVPASASYIRKGTASVRLELSFG